MMGNTFYRRKPFVHFFEKKGVKISEKDTQIGYTKIVGPPLNFEAGIEGTHF